MMRRDVFQAIADPTRRAIIGMLASKPLNINNVADQFSISRPAISKHMKILTECGLITITRQGRENYCHANFGRLKEVADWTAHYQKFWMEKLDALNDFLEMEKQQGI
jgi:DNA-binding transcriptional ArsR family regulator